ncbi:MAG: transaldolase family protein [Alphaproteobacteria bacterium]
MRLYIDSALASDWEKWMKRGVLYGATTNPLIFQKQAVDVSKRAMLRMVDQAKAMGLQALQLQVSGFENPRDAAKRMGRFFDRWQDGVVAKVPLTAQAMAVVEHLPKDMPITLTAAFDARQAVLAAGQGARYIAPYYGRLREAGADADGIVDDMLQTCKGQPRVLLASLRTPEQVVSLAARGHDTFTLSPAVFDALLDVPASVEATAQFEAAAAHLNAVPKPGGGLFKR